MSDSVPLHKPPDYRRILIRLLEKIQRTGASYRQHSGALRRRANLIQDSALLDQAESFARCANDMKFMFDRATERITPEDIADIWREQDKRAA